ncbi:MAG TPA: GreA/GreB family elongation factor [Phycisphaerae bacterium]|nr:GreA/GreB family elongation factor [Phycisphaerae bacterium]
MEIEALVQLAGSGDVAGVEAQWMTVLESEWTSPDTVVELLPVLAALVEARHVGEASTLAWAALETLAGRYSEVEVLPAAVRVLLQLPDSDEIREQVVGLYRRAYADRPGIEVLLKEAGIGGTCPARRALRTLEVCLQVGAGAYLAARHDDSSARIAEVDERAWQFQVRTREGEQQFGPVELADRYQPVDADDYRVLRDFDRERLGEMLEKDPGRIVVSILQAQGRTVDGDELKDMLCASLIDAERWGKWWPKARTALKRCPNVEIDGRSPFYFTYRREGRTLEEETRGGFVRLHDPGKQLAAVEAYLRECKARKQPPDRDLLSALGEKLAARAGRQEKSDRPLALATRLVQRRIEQELGETRAEAAAVHILASTSEPVAIIQALDVVPLWESACRCLEQAWPDRRAEFFADLLPVAPLAACEDIAARLTAAGFTPERFEKLEQAILGDPIRCHDALFWLWTGPSHEGLGKTDPLTLLSRILWLLSELRRREDIGKEEARGISTTARSMLSARKFERFRGVLEGVEPGMALTLRTQLRRLDNLGRVVREDLLKLINRRFPQLSVAATVEPWADESVLWVTSSGMVRKQQEMEQHVNVKMKENARRIGEAAAHGDLSENSEYKFALEERDLLRSRLVQMQDQMSRAKVISPEDIPTNHVGVGSRVVLRHVEAETPAELTLLGPWDANLARHIYNYQTPLAQSMMGRTVGEVVELAALEPAGRYEVVAIENGLS